MRSTAASLPRRRHRDARCRRAVAAAALVLAVSAAVPATAGAEDAPPVTSTVTSPASGYADNPFIPTDANLGDCVSSLPRPDCGSTARGGAGQWLTFVAMTSALVFIAWRVTRAIRRRDRTLAVRPDA